MLRILYSLIVVGLLGGLFGIGLAVAARLLAVKKDETVEEINAILPGLNCGACGYAGCASYAEAMQTGEAGVTLCIPGGPDVAERLGDLLGVSVSQSKRRMVAFVHCRGDDQRAEKAFAYQGLSDCNAVYALFKGDKQCKYGCLGLGSCVRECPVDAISYTKGGLVRVDPDLCISCEKCVAVCPTGVIRMIPDDADVAVACNSTDKGGVVRKYCTVGCLGCRLCNKKSPDGGFEINDFLAKIDYDTKGSRYEAVAACPTKCIVPVRDECREKDSIIESKESLKTRTPAKKN
jgi:Na+-translocating ferredoxin:NAD+ oxidoreductase subunit B